MTNAEKFQEIFKKFATEVWAFPEKDFLTWLNAEYSDPIKGHWIMTGDYFTGAYESIDYVKCSSCGEESLEEGNYCPNCGADMREEQK